MAWRAGKEAACERATKISSFEASSDLILFRFIFERRGWVGRWFDANCYAQEYLEWLHGVEGFVKA
jgi:hypothetical protein